MASPGRRDKDGNVLILDADSGNDYGERMYALPIKGNIQLRDEARRFSNTLS